MRVNHIILRNISWDDCLFGNEGPGYHPGRIPVKFYGDDSDGLEHRMLPRLAARALSVNRIMF